MKPDPASFDEKEELRKQKKREQNKKSYEKRMQDPDYAERKRKQGAASRSKIIQRRKEDEDFREDLNEKKRLTYEKIKNNADYREKKKAAASRYLEKKRAKKETDPAFREECRAKERMHEQKRNLKRTKEIGRAFVLKKIADARASAKRKEDPVFDLDKEENIQALLKMLRTGSCSVTRIPWNMNSPAFRPSLDRIVSSKYYTIDNVHWVCQMYNNLKGNMSEEEVGNLIQTMQTATEDDEEKEDSNGN